MTKIVGRVNAPLLHTLLRTCINMVFNTPMNSHEASKLIEASGGDIAFARLLGLDEKPGTRQRINNWKRRGIPASVVLEHLEAIDALRCAAESREAA